MSILFWDFDLLALRQWHLGYVPLVVAPWGVRGQLCTYRRPYFGCLDGTLSDGSPSLICVTGLSLAVLRDLRLPLMRHLQELFLWLKSLGIDRLVVINI